MLKGYQNYKDWWRTYMYQKGLEDRRLCFEEAFENHLNSLTNYELMETLKDWEDDGEV